MYMKNRTQIYKFQNSKARRVVYYELS